LGQTITLHNPIFKLCTYQEAWGRVSYDVNRHSKALTGKKCESGSAHSSCNKELVKVSFFSFQPDPEKESIH
jgi:hypothetical protein